MTFALSFDFEDASTLYHMGMPAAGFRDEELAGRFDNARKNSNVAEMPELLIASEEYDNGSLLWCISASDALLLAKIHQGAGHKANLLWDNAGTSAHEVHVVLTTWDLSEDEPELTAEEVIVELSYTGDDEEGESAEGSSAVITRNLASVDKLETLGSLNAEDHGDHFHITLIVKLPGNLLKEVVANIAQEMAGTIRYGIVSS